MTQAQITVNTVAGSNTDLPINMLVQLSNNGNGGETTYSWSILSQPPGTADTLSSTTIQNPTFTPKKEGTYHLQLVVNASLVDERVDRIVCSVLQLKTRTRVPAPGETDEASASSGHALSVNETLRLVDSLRADPGVMVAQLGYAAASQDVVRFTSVATIKSGLPGEEKVPVVTKALATQAYITTEELGLVIAAVDGGALSNGKLAYIRLFGLVAPATSSDLTGAADEATVYVSDTGTLDNVAGSNSRRVGKVIDATGTLSVYFKG